MQFLATFRATFLLHFIRCQLFTLSAHMKHLIVLSCLISCAIAWGPVSHLYFACQAYSNSPVDCANSISSQNLFWGGLLPDGLAVDPFMEGNNCSWSPTYTHDGVFAGWMYLQAMDTHDQELIDFAKGYAAHIMSDSSGFYTDANNQSAHGYMTKKYPVDWTLQWLFMADVDAYIYQNLSLTSVPLVPITPKVLDFFSKSTFGYSAIKPGFPGLTTQTVQECATNWLDLVRTMTKRSSFLNRASYLNDLLFFDKYDATTDNDVVNHLNLANYCAYKVVADWFKFINQLNDPTQAFKNIVIELKQLYETGECLPY